MSPVNVVAQPTALVPTLPQAILDRQSDQLLLAAAKAAFLTGAPGLDVVEGSFPHDLLAPFCLLLAQAYMDLADVERRTSLATAMGVDLDVLGDMYGVARAAAGLAAGTVTFTGAAGSTIPATTRISTFGPNAVVFQTTASATVGTGGTVDVAVEAVLPGAVGNVGAGMVVFLAPPAPAGLTGVTNTLPMTGGTDEQVDGAPGQYLAGYRADIRALSDARGEGGAAKHIRKWARGVAGVGAVRVLEATPTPGWVTVILMDSAGLPAGAGVVQAIEDTLLDPWRLTYEAETLIVGGSGVTFDSQPDATPTGPANSVRMSYSATAQGSLVLSRLDLALPQPGIWRVVPFWKRGAALGQNNALQYGVWDLTAAAWAKTRPNGTIDANVTRPASALGTVMAEDAGIDVAWLGVNQLEFRLFRLQSDTSTDVWVDQVRLISTMSRDDRDVGKTPAGMRLLVEPPATVAINVAAVITYALQSGQTQASVQTDIATNIAAHLANLALTEAPVVRRAEVEDVIYTTRGVGDVSAVTLNGQATNVPLTATQIPTLGTTTWS